MAAILEEIISYKRIEIEAMGTQEIIKSRRPASFKKRLENADTMSVIGEVKRASPSKGDINIDIDPKAQAEKYVKGGVDVISVLTDRNYFKGSLRDLEAVKCAVDVPVLNKDFIIDERQIDRAYLYGADIILLIVAALDDETLKRLYDHAASYGMECIVEVHTKAEMERALKLEPEIIGINNRDLKTFEVDIANTEQLLEEFGDADTIFIAESGIRIEEDARRMKDAGARALLVGETLMRAEHPEQVIESLKVAL
ncbi:indole-3-glycerol phosphate synthase TrpC [Salinicoccus sp. ID82-1]|uniref:Indole-3-glycerol phosphate synthase n=1 Tax=Salinicoccus cyprini TaxID=2493691 RepID=A0A558AWX8_9STAP|nr:MULTISPECIES: indole-3-glycerol phosphate synthase TrpC [Salinicoccus]MCG1010073.1 indole-3-glycerol phosphate synthase TrpC [Salinicoccus sp. ID82-1]TVT28763.1 indole-3-glycerol phosphate synthase TrpC [Salinicoccus cyprini]